MQSVCEDSSERPQAAAEIIFHVRFIGFLGQVNAVIGVNVEQRALRSSGMQVDTPRRRARLVTAGVQSQPTALITRTYLAPDHAPCHAPDGGCLGMVLRPPPIRPTNTSRRTSAAIRQSSGSPLCKSPPHAL